MELLVSTEEDIRRWISRAQGGDRKAFEELTRFYAPRLASHIRKRLGPGLGAAADVDDVLQETYLRGLRGIDRFRAEGDDSFLRWLKGIALNVVLETASRARRDPLASPVDDAPARDLAPSRSLQRKERFDRLQDALEVLSPEHRRVIVLARLEKLPVKEIARRMDRSPAAVSMLLLRALEKLKAAFGETDSFRLPPWELKRGGGDHE